MPKAEWGTKRICPTTGKRFYDLNKSPIVSPYTGEVVDIESVRRKMAASVISRAVPDTDDDVLVEDLENEDALLEGATTDDNEMDDDLLEDDADDNVSLDDLADVGGGRVDVAVRYGRGDYSGVRSERLLSADVTPVCSPALAAGDPSTTCATSAPD